METIRVALAGAFTPGEPLDRTENEIVRVPADLMGEDEELYRVMHRGIGRMNIKPDDILVVQPRPEGNAATAETVLVEFEGRAYVGRWWTKKRRRAVLDEDYEPIVEGPGVRVLGVIITIARLGIWR